MTFFLGLIVIRFPKCWRQSTSRGEFSYSSRFGWEQLPHPPYSPNLDPPPDFYLLSPHKISTLKEYKSFVAERTSYFCLARKSIWPLWSSHIFTQGGWLILFNPDHFPGQHKNGESPPNFLFLRTFRAGRTYFLSAPFIAAESQHHEKSRLIYGPLESALLVKGFPVEHEVDAFNQPLTGTPLCCL